jgi:hypothetical protein
MTWTVKTGSLLSAQIHGYLLGLKSIKTWILGLPDFGPDATGLSYVDSEINDKKTWKITKPFR